MSRLVRDLRYAVRALLRTPVFTLAAVLTLALGIGVNTVMFSVADSLLWQPLPVAHPADLVNLFRYNPAVGSWGDLPYADYLDMRASHGAFADIAAYYPEPFGLSEGGRSERTWGELVSGNYFTMLGVPAARGRTFDAAEAAGGAPVVVISDGLWRRRFGADPAAVGRTLRINGQFFTIIGVVSPRFHGVYYPGFTPDLWMPAEQLDAVEMGPPGRLTARNGRQFRMMARLAPGASAAQAQAQARTVLARIAAEEPARRGLDVRVVREREARPEPAIAAGFTLAARLLLGGVALVLLIACANVANLLLARATARRREIAVRLALGASRGRLVGQLLVESGVLAVLGGAAGIGLALWGTSLVGDLLRIPSDIPFVFTFAVDGRVLAYTAALTILAALAFGMVPALQAVRPALVGALKNDSTVLRGVSGHRLRGALVVAQIAVSVVVLVTAGLALRTLANLRHVDPGFDASHGLLVTVAPDLQRYDHARGETLYRELQGRVAALPGVRAASLMQYVPMDFSSNGGRVYVPGHEASSQEASAESAGWALVMPGAFDALGVRLVAGRDFTTHDDSLAPDVAIVSETFAQRYWPGQDAVGHQLRLREADGPLLTVVGVAQDMKYNNLMESPTAFVYLPLTQSYEGYATLVVRTATDAPRALAPAVTGIVTSLDPDLAYDVRTFADLMTGRALILPRLGAWLAGAFGLLALLLVSVGLYGVVAYGVGQRTREIGIRVALGADRRTVVRMVVGGGLAQAGLGLAIGTVLAFGATRALGSLLFGVRAADPLTFGTVAALLIAVALAAGWLPARRAARVDPVEALRSE